MSIKKLDLPADYPQLLKDLKQQIQTARVRARLSVNHELILLYWRIGREILQRQAQAGWGAKIITQLSLDLRKAFPEMTGLSRTNLLYMRKFAKTYFDEQFVQRVVGQLPWGHNIALFEKLKDPEQRLWYAEKTVLHGWSRDVLIHQIANGLIHREGKAPTNFSTAIPDTDSELTEQLFKDPYNLEFLDVGGHAHERYLERALIDRLKVFMLELGSGFAFVGNQVHLEVGGDDFYVDLLFYHLHLHRYIVIELKRTKFIPEYVSKVNFYCSVIDDQLRHRDDETTIGLILCKNHNRVVAEYALRDSNKPVGISQYTLPRELQGALPSVEDLEAELTKENQLKLRDSSEE